MENENTTTEQHIKNRIERVVASRALFEATMRSVTEAQTKRYTSMKAVPSPYQSFLSTMRAKAVGLSLVVVAIIAVVVLKTGNSDVLPAVSTTQTPGQTTVTTPAASTDTNTSSSEVDDIVASLNDDATAEGMIGASEETDGTALTQDVEDYTIDDNTLI